MGGGIGEDCFYLSFCRTRLGLWISEKKVSMGGELEIINLFLFFVGSTLDFEFLKKKVSMGGGIGDNYYLISFFLGPVLDLEFLKKRLVWVGELETIIIL